MAIPKFPYCDTDDVAMLVPNMVAYGDDFSTSTAISKIAVNKFITWVAAEIDMAFATVGFYVPYQVISGETWNDSQTTMLRMMTSFGAAGMCAGPVIKPAPAMGGQGGKSENAYRVAYKGFLESIPTNAAGFRMNYRVGSKAEQICRTPRGPTTDYLEGFLDPTLYQTVSEYTTMVENIRTNYGIDLGWQMWDHLKTRRDSILA